MRQFPKRRPNSCEFIYLNVRNVFRIGQLCDFLTKCFVTINFFIHFCHWDGNVKFHIFQFKIFKNLPE